MRHAIKSLVLSLSAVAAVNSAGAAQPPDVVTTDAKGNTAMGTNVLYSITSGNSNTAAGGYALVLNTTGTENTAVGYDVMGSNTTGSQNTGVGAGVLGSGNGSYNTAVGSESMAAQNSSGSYNTALGASSMNLNTTGDFDTASGYHALGANTTGNANTATGYEALLSNQAGSQNTADGFNALLHNTASNNTAVGFSALSSTTSGASNVAVGVAAMNSNTSGYYNTSLGEASLYYNSSGYYNTAAGGGALNGNTIGVENAAFGVNALLKNSSGNSNIALGYSAGSTTTGSNNIDIGNVGAAGENGVIRLGAVGAQAATYVAGITGAKITGSAVYVTASGQLGVLASSERYKTSIASMGSNTEKLRALRPVTFHLKSDPAGAVQYGLIAEEVNRVYPELVIRGATGSIEGVRYDELAPLLLNEFQKLHDEVRQQRQALAKLQRMNESLQATVASMQATPERVALR